ncbi:MAG: MMPL family transporter [Litorimonas sp.]
MSNRLGKLFKSYFEYPYILLICVLGAAILAAGSLKHFSYDASSETLIADNDKELAYYRDFSENFSNESFLFLTYQPNDADLFTPDAIEKLSNLQTQLEAINGVSDVTSILDIPLLKSPPVELAKIATDYKTLRLPGVDFTLAKEELSNSPLFKELLISEDGQATAMRVSLQADREFEKLQSERQYLASLNEKTPEQVSQLASVKEAYLIAKRNYIADQERILDDIRQIQTDLKSEATVYLSGVPVIASDMVRFVKADISTFGGVSLIGIMLILFLFFRRLKWVILPLLTALLSVLIVAGILGGMRQAVTVISANFVALLIIFSMSFTVHLMVRYRELAQDMVPGEQKALLTSAMMDKFAPCLYTGLTTMTAFASLTLSGIKPIVDLGWIMCLAMVVAFIVNYTFFPAMVRILPVKRINPLPSKEPALTSAMKTLSLNAPKGVFLATLVVIAVSAAGMSRLNTDGRFIDYFRETSDIKQGLVFVDEAFGGTVPMDVVLNFKPFVPDELEGEDDFFDEEPDAFPQRYWYTPDKVEKLHQMEDYLASLPQVGKIISIATLEEIARGFNEGEALSTIELAAVIGLLPEELRDEFLRPYSVPDKGIMRISLRMKETAPRHSRDVLIKAIEDHAIRELGFKPEDVRVTGLNVFFNNMLKGLYQSQLSTIGLVVFATFIMFLMLMRSFRLAAIGVLPNLLSAIIILGFMGFMNITLDMMTITIAAIIIGIGVDNAIHYLHRFRTEIANGLSVTQSIEASHGSIGFALYFTSATVIVGFSVLGLSNFIPTIYFGLLTALAMAVSLVINLVVLPSLLMLFYKAAPKSATA